MLWTVCTFDRSEKERGGNQLFSDASYIYQEIASAWRKKIVVITRMVRMSDY